MSEITALVERVLNREGSGPDDDVTMLARQFLQSRDRMTALKEENKRLRATLNIGRSAVVMAISFMRQDSPDATPDTIIELLEQFDRGARAELALPPAKTS